MAMTSLLPAVNCIGSRIQKLFQTLFQLCEISCLALPYDKDTPPISTQFALHLQVPLAIAFKFGRPKFCPRDRSCRKAASGMLVPKAAMYKNYFLPTRENQVRITGQILAMKSKAITHAMN